MDKEEFQNWRASHGWTQRETAKRLGVHIRTVRSYEGGRRNISEAIATAMKLIDQLEERK